MGAAVGYEMAEFKCLQNHLDGKVNKSWGRNKENKKNNYSN